jgi:hypothetical protein
MCQEGKVNTYGVGSTICDRIVQKVSLDLSGRIFETDLVVLSGQGIDVILGMSWMKWHKAILDISARLVHLKSHVYGKVLYTCPQSLTSRRPYIMWLREG